MNDNIFSWQQKDFESLVQSYHHRVFLLHSKDITNPYHVSTSFSGHLMQQGHSLFILSKSELSHVKPLLPFLSAAHEIPYKSKSETKITRSIVKDITKSDTLAQLVENIAKPEKQSSFFLDEREHTLITHFSVAAGDNPPVFIFLGFPHYDSSSQELIHLLVSGNLDCDFPFLQYAKYIFLCEIEDDISSYRHIQLNKHIDISLSEHTVMDMDEILSEIAPDLKLQDTEIEKLFYLSGGRLSIIEILAEYLIKNDYILHTSTPQDAVNLVLADRLEHMGEQGIHIKKILETAAAIGNVFQIPLLKQAIQQKELLDQTLNKCDHEFFTICNEDIGKFRYDEIWEYFYHHTPGSRAKEASLLIANAIYFFNPYDYSLRAHHLERAGELKTACEVYFLAYHASFQEDLALSDELLSKINDLSDQCKWGQYWAMLQKYYEEIQGLNFEKGLEVLDDMPVAISTRMLLLKEYLTGLCTHRASESEENQQNAFLAIENAAKYAKGIEDGIWCDCQTILISLSVNLKGDINRARSISKELSYFYTQKIHAPYAQKGLYALNRKYSALYSVEKAVRKTQLSVEFFREQRYPAQYIMAVNNHTANLIVLGRYAEAMDYFAEIAEFLSRHKCSHVNLMYLLNNYCLCTVLLGKLSPCEACANISPLLKDEPFGDWKIITNINYAIYLAKDGKLTEAKLELHSLQALSETLADDYYLYYVYANLAAIYYLQGRSDQALSILSSKCKQPPALLKETEKIYFRERTEKWIEVMETEHISDPQIYDSYLLSQHPPETQWNFIGRGFLYSDIQFWSEP